MPGIFDKKLFNAEVFAGYIGRIPNVKQNALIASRAIRPRPELAQVMAEQTGGNYITTQLTGLISSSTVQNYDGVGDLNSNETTTFDHARVVVGRMDSWVESDFARDITGGKDFLEDVAAQIAGYWVEVDQDTIIHILNGIFKMADTQGAVFVSAHTHDITEVANSEGQTGKMDGTSLNTAMQKACGANKGAFSLVCMHSAVATNLENLKLLTYMKYNDAEGIEREVGLATLNGRIVLVDDGMPVDTSGDAPVYTSYVLGDGAIEYTDCGAAVPYEPDRNPYRKGGQDVLISRQRKCWAPYGISFTKASMARQSPTDAELETGTNWKLVNSMAETGAEYIDHKAIPIARILSLG